MLTRPFTRLVVAFGQRRVTQRQLVEEIVLGLLILTPFGFFVGLLTSRLCTKIQLGFVRSDIWTTVVVFLVGDVLMEWLLPSLSCLPMPSVNGDFDYSLQWLLQSYGIMCPKDFAASATLLSPDATAILFSLRLVFLCLGVHIGENLCFIALTGGIATGKSTVGAMLVEYNDIPESNTAVEKNKKKRKPKRGSIANTSSNNSTNNADNQADEYKEGTVSFVCTDKVSYQILLPPALLAQGEHDHQDDDDAGGLDDSVEYLVHSNDSVYKDIIHEFSGEDILTDDNLIDRVKLGAIVVKDSNKRQTLNRITHPRIMIVLLQHLLRNVFFGTCDLTIADIPLLFESGKLSWFFAVTICVTVSDPSVRLERLRKRNPGLSKQELESRIENEFSMTKKEKLADIVIDNTGDLNELSEQVENVRRDLMGRLYGIGMSLLQMLLLIGGSTSIAVSSKFYSHWQQ